jgi:hypothetical protein
MNPRNKVFLVLVAAFTALFLIACSCSTLNIPGLGSSNEESVPGLAGTWQDPETLDVFVIEWNGAVYSVSSVTYEGTSYNITSQSWTGSTLTWTYYIPEYDTSLTYETTSVSGDSLYTNWWNSQDNSGTEILQRID